MGLSVPFWGSPGLSGALWGSLELFGVVSSLCFMRMMVSLERCSSPDYSVSFMSEFHEVKCPEHIGRVAGNG